MRSMNETKRRHLCQLATLAFCLCVSNGATALADQFSFKCEQVQAGYLRYFTFDDLRKRVVAYNFLGGQIVGPLLRGDIRSVSDEEIKFDLVAYDNPNLKIGDFTLERKEGWMTPSRPGEQDRQPCEPTPLRTVMDLWQVLPHDP